MSDNACRLSKRDLLRLADGLLEPEPQVIGLCVEFVLAETRGVWHGRARAMMCRRLKHCDLEPAQRAGLVDGILQRLASGNFSEQFKDQLRLALLLDGARSLRVAADCEADGRSRPHARRYARWVLAHRNAG